MKNSCYLRCVVFQVLKDVLRIIFFCSISLIISSCNSSTNNNLVYGSLSLLKGYPISTGSHPTIMAITPNGRFLYVTNAGINAVSSYSISNNGSLIQIPGSPFKTGNLPIGITIIPDGGLMYVANVNDNTMSVFEIASTGVLTQIPGSPINTGNSPQLIAVSPNGRFIYVTNYGDNTVSMLLDC